MDSYIISMIFYDRKYCGWYYMAMRGIVELMIALIRRKKEKKSK